jgi:hypothetical protein
VIYTRPTIVYVSGPITTGGNVPVNVRRGIEAATLLMDRGYVAICPHEKVLGMEMLAPRSYEEWMQYDFRCIEASDAVYRMPGESTGGDREVAYARKLGRPVYYSCETLFAGMPAQLAVEVVDPRVQREAERCFICGYRARRRGRCFSHLD